MPNISHKNSRHLAQIISSILILALSGAGFMSWRLQCFPFGDDMPYSLCFPSDLTQDEFWECVSQTPIVTYSEAFQAATNHYLVINGRLSNIVHILFQPLPDQVEQIANGLMCTALLCLIVLASYGRKGLRSPFAVAVSIICTIIFLPWWDTMVSDDFTVNYVWPSVLVILFLLTFNKVASGCHMAPVAVIATGILAFITGWWHEGFAIPAGAAAVTILWEKRQLVRHNRLTWIIFLALLAGFMTSFSPGQLSRITSESNAGGVQFSTTGIYNALRDNKLLYLYIIIFLIYALRKGRGQARAALLDQSPWLAGFAAALSISMILKGYGRINWAPTLFLIIANMRLLYHGYRWFDKPLYIPAYLLTAIIVAFFSCVTYWQYKVKVNATQIHAFIGQRANMQGSIAYVDAITFRQIPWHTLGFVSNMSYGHNMRSLSYYSGYRNHMIILLPAKYRGNPFHERLKIPGNNSFYGIYPIYFSKDSLGLQSYRATVGNPVSTGSMNPVSRTYLTWKHRHSKEWRDTLIFNMETRYTAVTPEGETLYYYIAPHLGRMARGRAIIAIDKTM